MTTEFFIKLKKAFETLANDYKFLTYYCFDDTITDHFDYVFASVDNTTNQPFVAFTVRDLLEACESSSNNKLHLRTGFLGNHKEVFIIDFKTKIVEVLNENGLQTEFDSDSEYSAVNVIFSSRK